LAAAGHGGQALFAVTLVARMTFAGAANAQIAVATPAEGHTIAAERSIAPITGRVFVRPHPPTAVAAGDATPVAQTDMGAVGVVRLQHLTHEDEEIEQSA